MKIHAAIVLPLSLELKAIQGNRLLAILCFVPAYQVTVW